jgi:hypothetical protein
MISCSKFGYIDDGELIDGGGGGDEVGKFKFPLLVGTTVMGITPVGNNSSSIEGDGRF